MCITTDLHIRWWETHHFLLVLQLELFISTTHLLLCEMIHWHLSKRYNDRSSSQYWILIRHPAGGIGHQYYKRLGLRMSPVHHSWCQAEYEAQKITLVSFVPASSTSQEILFAWSHDLCDKSRSISVGRKLDEHLSKGWMGLLLGHLFSLRTRKENYMLEGVIPSNPWCHNSNIFITVAQWQNNWRRKDWLRCTIAEG